jgi:hypothetical protein
MAPAHRARRAVDGPGGTAGPALGVVLQGSRPRLDAAGIQYEPRRRHGVELKPRLVNASGRTVSFADNSELEADAVIWATGYRSDCSWIELSVFDPDARVGHTRGVTDVPGLYFLDLTWQHTRGSALLGWVKEDAEYIAGHRGS